MSTDGLQPYPQIGVFVSEAQRSCAMHNYTKAIVACTKALELDEDNMDVRLLRSRCYMLSGHISQSIIDAQDILRSDPSNHRAHFCLSEALFQAAEFEQSCVSLYRCIELRPDVRAYLQGIKRSEQALRCSCKFSMHDMNLLLDLLEIGIIIDSNTIENRTDASVPSSEFYLWQVPSIAQSPLIDDDSPNLSLSFTIPTSSTMKSTPKPRSLSMGKSIIVKDVGDSAFLESLSNISCIKELVSSGLEFTAKRDAFWVAKSPRSISAPKITSVREVSQPLSPLSRSKSTRTRNSASYELRGVMKAIEAQRPAAALQCCKAILNKHNTMSLRTSLFIQLVQQCALLSLGDITGIEQLRRLMKLSVRLPDMYIKVVYNLAKALLSSSPAESISLSQNICTIPAAQRNPVLIGYTCALEVKAMHILSRPNTQRHARIACTTLQNIVQKNKETVSDLLSEFEFFNPQSPEELLYDIKSIIKDNKI